MINPSKDPFLCSHTLMLNCWRKDSENRPSFKQITAQLEDFSMSSGGNNHQHYMRA